MWEKPRKTKGLLEKVEDMCAVEGIPEPMRYMVALMAGRDPRPGLGALMQALDLAEDSEGSDGRPRQEEWETFKFACRESEQFRSEVVMLQDSATAGRVVLEYTRSKLKSVLVSGELEHLVVVKPLTNEEIQRLESELIDEF